MPKFPGKKRARRQATAVRMARQGYPGDSIVAVLERIHERANDIRAPRMFALADNLPDLDERATAQHECSLALREHAGIPQFGRRCLSVWDAALDDWMVG